MNETRSSDILKLMKLTGKDKDSCIDALDQNDGDIDAASIYLGGAKKKKPKEKKVFKIGDVVVCIDTKQGKLPQDCYEFLLTYKKFRVIDINDKLNIDLGHRLAENGNPFFFAPNRFDLLEGKAPVKVIEPEPKVAARVSKIVKDGPIKGFNGEILDPLFGDKNI